MELHHIRNATFVIEADSNFILVDPMLSEKGKLPPFSVIRHKARKNPIVPLPVDAPILLNKVTHCLITHSHTFGIKALQHTDHLDAPGEALLRKKGIPVVCRKQDGVYLKKLGINVALALNYWEPEQWLGGEITAVPARHGHGWIHKIMANGAGFFLQLPGEPSIYISGDTVYTSDVESALKEFKPDIAIMASGSASMDFGGPILMPLKELLTFARNAPGKVVANHLEALNHCPTTREQLREALRNSELLDKTLIPEDGETIIF